MTKHRRAISLERSVGTFVDSLITSSAPLEAGQEIRIPDRERSRLTRWLRKVGGFPNAERMIDAVAVSINAELERRGSDLRIEWTTSALVVRREES